MAAKKTGDVEPDIGQGNSCKILVRKEAVTLVIYQNYGSFYRQTSNAKQEAKALFLADFKC